MALEGGNLEDLAVVIALYEEDDFAYIEKITADSNVKLGVKLINDLQYLDNNPKVMKDGLFALWVLLSNDKNRDVLFSRGVVQLVVNSLRAYSESRQIAELACGILEKATGNLKMFFLMGAADEVLAAMERFPDEEKVQKNGCNAINALGKFRFNADGFVQKKVCEKIIRAMQTFEQSSDLQKAAIAALWCLAIYGESNEAIWNSNCTEHILKAMANFKGIERVQENSCGFLFTIGFTFCLMKLGAANAVLDAMRAHPGHEKIVLYGSFVLKNMGQFKTCAGELVYLGAAEVIMDCINTNQDAYVREQALLALWSLSLWKGTKKDMLNKRVGKFSIDLLTQSAEVKVFNGSVSVLTNLATEKCNHKVLDRSQAGRFVVAGWTRNENDETCTEKSLFCLRNLFFYDRDGKNLRTLDIQEKITKSLEQFPGNSVIQRKGTELLDQIQRDK